MVEGLTTIDVEESAGVDAFAEVDCGLEVVGSGTASGTLVVVDSLYAGGETVLLGGTIDLGEFVVGETVGEVVVGAIVVAGKAVAGAAVVAGEVEVKRGAGVPKEAVGRVGALGN